MTVDAKGRLCRAEEAFQHISEYSGSTHHVFGTPYGVFGFVFEGGELVEAYRDKIAIGPVADFDKQRLVFTEDHVFLGIKA